jgi:phospholipid-transporting ATPase
VDTAASSRYQERYFNFYDPRLMGCAWHSSPQAEHIAMFFRLLAVCHTVIPDGPQVWCGVVC